MLKVVSRHLKVRVFCVLRSNCELLVKFRRIQPPVELPWRRFLGFWIEDCVAVIPKLEYDAYYSTLSRILQKMTKKSLNSPGIFPGLVVFLDVFFRKFAKNYNKIAKCNSPGVSNVCRSHPFIVHNLFKKKFRPYILEDILVMAWLVDLDVFSCKL